MKIKLPAGYCKDCGATVPKSVTRCAAHKRPAKYRNTKTTWLDIVFDSKKEACRYAFLKGVMDGGGVKNLRRQVRYPLAVNGVLVCVYVADFVYEIGSETVVEDAKGMRTPEYNLKAKLFKAVYGFSIVEV